MKFLHLSDLHLGKRLNEFSLLEDQQYILESILGLVSNEKPQAVVIAGDVYDKPVPPVEAVRLFDKFLTTLASAGVAVIVIGGNHDSSDRLSFGSGLFKGSGVHIAPAYSGDIKAVTLSDEWGKVNFYPLPFIKPAHVNRFWPDDGICDYTSAVRTALEHAEIDYSQRNVLVCHQFVTGAARCESEELSVGGLDNVDSSVFSQFDYVALGHIHGPQKIGTEHIRYCGSPLKYSFSESLQKKSVPMVEMGKKGDINVKLLPLVPRRELKVLRGTYASVTALSFTSKLNAEDYYKIILTDEEDVPEGVSKLRMFYPNLMSLEYDNSRTRSEAAEVDGEKIKDKTPMQLFEDLYERQNGRPMTEDMQKDVKELIESIWQGDGA